MYGKLHGIRYVSTTVALCPVVEGVIADSFNNPNEKILKIGTVLNSMLEKVNEKDTILNFSFLSTYRFMKEMFDFADFSKNEPMVIVNRHWYFMESRSMN